MIRRGAEHRLEPSELAPGLLLGDGVEIADGVEIGANVVIHAGTQIGPGALIQDGAILGKLTRLAPRSSAPRDGRVGAVLGEGSAVLAGAVVFAGAILGRNTIVGDQTQVRERAVIGAGSVIGRGSAVDNDVRIGARVRVQTNSYVTAFAEIEDDVFVGPGVTMANDHTMGRHAKEEPLLGPRLRRACRVGAGVVICPGVEIGEEAFVAAGSVVTGDVPRRGVVVGVPARQIREVTDADLLERWL